MLQQVKVELVFAWFINNNPSLADDSLHWESSSAEELEYVILQWVSTKLLCELWWSQSKSNIRLKYSSKVTFKWYLFWVT